MNNLELQQIIQHALEEDLGSGDLTGRFFSPEDRSAGRFMAKADGILAGVEVINETYHLLDNGIEVTSFKHDGDPVLKGEMIAGVEGPTAALLSGERVILNFLQHMSGIATATKKAVDALGSTKTKICDTRKTLPGLRMLQKYAVRCGGGFNHRYRLDDGVMIKDNHITAAGSIAKAVRKLREQVGLMVRIEVETETRDQVLEAVEAGADIIMFDNRSADEVRGLMDLVPGHIITEVSGGITPETIGKYRDTGVDFISLGYLTHSVQALDISFNLT